METLIVVINILLILTALVLIVAVLMQEGNRAGLGAIGGGAETFFGKSKAKSVQGKLNLITKIGMVVFIVLAITCTALVAYQHKAKIALHDAQIVEQTIEDAASQVEAGTESPDEPLVGVDPETGDITEPGAEPEPVAEPETDSAAAPVAEPETDSAAAPVAEPETEPAAPVAEPEPEAVTEPEPVAEPTAEPEAPVEPAA